MNLNQIREPDFQISNDSVFTSVSMHFLSHVLLACAFLAMTLAFQQRIGLNYASIFSRRFLFGSPEPPKTPPIAKKDGGMFGGMGNIMESMKKAQEIAKQSEVVQKELMETVINGQDSSGQVVAAFTGLGSPISVRVSDAMAAQGGEAASLAVTQAVVDGYTKAQSHMVNRMQQLYSSMGVPLPGGPPK